MEYSVFQLQVFCTHKASINGKKKYHCQSCTCEINWQFQHSSKQTSCYIRNCLAPFLADTFCRMLCTIVTRFAVPFLSVSVLITYPWVTLQAQGSQSNSDLKHYFYKGILTGMETEKEMRRCKGHVQSYNNITNGMSQKAMNEKS